MLMLFTKESVRLLVELNVGVELTACRWRHISLMLDRCCLHLNTLLNTTAFLPTD